MRISKEKEVFPVGDALEYMLMTEAIYNHGAPDIRFSDYLTFKALYSKTEKWETNPAGMFYDQAGQYLAKKDVETFESFSGFFADKNSEIYSCHFFIYSFINVPMRFVCEWVNFNPYLIHPYTNVLLILITCLLFFKYSYLGEQETSVFVLLFFYSTNYWYLLWQHPEIFTACLATLGLWIFVGKKYYWGILLVSIASLQNQPLAILVAALCIITLFINRITIKNIFLIGASSVWVLLPSIFYYYNFGVPSLITHVGSMQTRLVTFTRVLGFFFDLNQGVILALPFVLFLYLGFIIQKVILFKKQENKWELLIPSALIGAVILAAGIDNWNSGQAVVSRYVTYIGGIILVHCFLFIVRIKNKKVKMAFIGISLASQIATVYYHESITKHDWSAMDPKPIANWILTKEPQLYNPDPSIFLTRYGNIVALDTTQSPAYFMKTTGQITKFLVHKNSMYNLVNFGIPKKQIYKALENISFENNWAYINVDREFKSDFSPEKLKAIDNERRVLFQMKLIKTIPDWYQKIKLKAKQKGIEEDEMLRRDAAFVLSIPTIITGTREEIIEKSIKEMKITPEWRKLMTEKANKSGITLDSAIIYEAKKIADGEIKKRMELEKLK